VSVGVVRGEAASRPRCGGGLDVVL